MRRWKRPASTEQRYYVALSRLIKAVKRLADTHNSIPELTAAISALADTPKWKEIAVVEAHKMVKSVAVHNAQSWREAAQQAQSRKGAEIHRVLQQRFGNNVEFMGLIERNSLLIKSLPQDIAKHVTQQAATQTMAGHRASEVMTYIREVAPELSHARIQLIARTEVAKTQAAIVKHDAIRTGCTFYTWRTSEDQRVRTSHKHMDGVICSFSSPPSPEQLIGETAVGYYNAGDIWNCRCYSEVIVDPDFLTWPQKIVRNNRIVSITKREFMELL